MEHEQFISALSGCNIAADDVQQELKLLFKAVYSGRDEDIKQAAEQLANAAAWLLGYANKIANADNH